MPIKFTHRHPEIRNSRVARQCVCCGSEELDRSPAVLMPFISHRVYNWAPVEIDASWGLKTIKPGYAYSLCNSLQCQKCGFLFLDIRFSPQEMEYLYRDYRGVEYTQLREHYEPGYTNRNNELNKGINYLKEVENFLLPYTGTPSSILDWGGDTGINTPFSSSAKTVHIFDISEKSVIPRAQRVSRKEADQNDYDLIACCGVIEHVPYPEKLLNDIRSVMSKKSLLYVDAPFEKIMHDKRADACRQKKHWHEHINFFSEKSLEILADRCGLKIIAENKMRVSSAGTNVTAIQLILAVS